MAWEISVAVAVVAVAMGDLVVVKWLNEWVVERRLPKEQRRRLPPGDMGWPLIGNMRAFLRAYKSRDPDSFLAAYARRRQGGRGREKRKEESSEKEMAWEIAVAVAVVAAMGGLVAVKWLNEWVVERRLTKEERRRLPPGDMGWPLIGNMWGFLRAYKSRDPDSFLAAYARRFNHTGIYKAFMFGYPAIMVTAPEFCKQVLMDDERFVPGWPTATLELIGRRSFIGDITPEDHKRLRKLTSAPINGYDALSTYLKFIESTVISSLEIWSEAGEIEFLTEMRRLTFKVIIHIFLSSESEGIMKSLEKVYTDLNFGMRALAINVPGFAYHKALKARKTLVTILQSVLRNRRDMRAKNPKETEKDMMDALINAEDEKGRKLCDEEIIDILIMYLNAGHESSGHTTMWATAYLERHPECLKKAKAEQEEILRNRSPTQKGLSLKEVRKMEYLSEVIDETLRIVSFSYVAFREATTDTEINGYVIPKGWKILLWYRNVHMDNEVYSDAKKFDPSRWDGLIPKPGTFLPFGGGSRLCPGNDLAKMEISVFLHYFLLGYEMERLNPNAPVRYLPHPRPVDNCKAIIRKISATSV